ncbi:MULTISPECIES: polysaccharide pyruvyl transferase family protein [Vibrio]|uniref:polysaccharide pyruvyl transferase family protein n=1 Tax=Vibrio TaxID=662 RepID=UPI002964B33D|nr:polysaccharide pyruvyl transferase family protein [Vibrio sp. 947]MDW1925168.1 polysaccharide pyruvyl transferase family protein [Vibrio sp. 947]
MKNVKEVLIEIINLKSRVKYFPNRGNAGDSLINVGFYMLAESIGLDYEIINYNEVEKISKDDVVITGGGGALVPEQLTVLKCYEYIIENSAKLIILPQSIYGVDDLVKRIRKQDVLFCREMHSLNYCQSITHDFELYIDDDMAFHVDFEKLKGIKINYSPELSLYNSFRFLIFNYHKLVGSKINSKILAFRCDREINSNILVSRKKHNDISAVARFAAGGVDESFYSAKKFLELIDLYEEIFTDRLHVVIAAGILGKRVFAYSNSYYKVEGIIEYSMSGFANVVKI